MEKAMYFAGLKPAQRELETPKVKVPPPLSAGLNRPDKETLAKQQVTRFAQNQKDWDEP